MTKHIPTKLKDRLLPFNWDVQKVWALDAPEERVPTNELAPLLELPFWSSKPNSGMLFDLSPVEVIKDLDRYAHQKVRILNADIRFPIDFIIHEKRFYILDGLHRLARLQLEGAVTVRIRKHSLAVQEKIQVTS
jgi:hypothetical protein